MQEFSTHSLQWTSKKLRVIPGEDREAIRGKGTHPRRVCGAKKNVTTSGMYPQKLYFVYVLASKPYGTLYTGVTGDITGRI